MHKVISSFSFCSKARALFIFICLKMYFILIWKAQLGEQQRGRVTQRELVYVGPLPKWPQRSELSISKARSWASLGLPSQGSKDLRHPPQLAESWTTSGGTRTPTRTQTSAHTRCWHSSLYHNACLKNNFSTWQKRANETGIKNITWRNQNS